MAKVVKGARFISKITEVPGVAPTIPPNDDHTLGWKDTDIYVGEWFWNITDGKIYYRDNNGISSIITPDPNTGQIDPSLLPGNYFGAMVYQGTWDASSGNPPYVGNPATYIPEKGDYFIVDVSGNTSLSGEVDWQIGDYAICNVGGTPATWDKIDNTEPTIYANNVLYDNSTYTSLTNVNEALEKIFDEKFITPSFDNTVTIDISTFSAGKTALQINGNDTKWINWDGSTANGELGLGTSTELNSILKVGPKGSSGYAALTSALDLHWSNAATQTLRWRTYSSNTDGYIMGYNDSGNPGLNDETNTNTKISAMSDSYFNVGNFGVGTKTPATKIEARGTIRSSNGTYHSDLNEATLIFSRNDANYIWAETVGGYIMFGVNGDTMNSSNAAMRILVNKNVQMTSDLSVTGGISSSTATITNGIGADSATITNNMGAGSITTSGTLHVTGNTSLTSLASYDDYTTITIGNYNDIPHRFYVDNEIALHAVGHWRSGTTFEALNKDVVVFNNAIGHQYYVGINKENPTYNLDVVGNVLISSTLDINGVVNINGNRLNLTQDGTTGTYGMKFDAGGEDTNLYLDSSDDFNIERGSTTIKVAYEGAISLVHSGTQRLITTSSGIQVSGDSDLNGGINVSGNVDLGSSGAGAGNINLRGDTVQIVNTGDSDNINLRFNYQSSLGDQVIAIEDIPSFSSNTTKKLTIRGQASLRTSGTYNGGDLDLLAGNGNNSTTFPGAGGNLTIKSGLGGTCTATTDGNKGGDLTIEARNGGAMGGSTGWGGEGGSLSLSSGNAGSGYYNRDGGSISITSGNGSGSYLGGNGGDIIISSGDGTIGSSTTGNKGGIYIDHIINETYKTNHSYSTSYADITWYDVVPYAYNFINCYINNSASYMGLNQYLYLGNLQLPNHDFMVTIQVYLVNTAGSNGCYLSIKKELSGTSSTTTIILVNFGSSAKSGYFTATLTWNHVREVWTVLAISEENTYTVTTPNGNTV